jgi:Cu-processing system permease protein
MIHSFTALALNGFREARRNKVTVVVAVFAIALILSSTLVTEATVATFDRILTDVGLGSMSLMLVLLAIFLSSGLLSREIERRTIFLIVTKPVSRGAFLVARLAGNMLTLGILLVAMGALFCAQVALYRSPVTSIQLVAMGMLWMELLVLSCVGFAMSSFSSQMVSAVVTTGVYFAGHLSGDIYVLASRSKNVALQLLGKVAYYALPNLGRFNYRAHASYGTPLNLTNEAPPELTKLIESIGYGFAYSGVLIVLAVVIFNRRDFK